MDLPSVISECVCFINLYLLSFSPTAAFLNITSPQLNYLLPEEAIMSDLKKLNKLHKGFFLEVNITSALSKSIILFIRLLHLTSIYYFKVKLIGSW